MVGFIECYDIGGTNIRGAIIADQTSPKILHIEHVRTIKGSKEELICGISSISHKFKEKFGNKIDAVSIGLPGPVKDGVLIKSPPMGIHEKIDLKSEIDASVPIYVDNDLNIATMAELKLGVGGRFKDFYLLSISTGIGAGIVNDGMVLRGTCGEFGHDVIESDISLANTCSCGNMGCWVATSSGHGIEMSYKRISGENKSTEEIYGLYREGEPYARTVIEMAAAYNAHGIGNMLNAFSADAIAVMGSVGLNMFNDVIPDKDAIKKFTVNDVPEILPTTLGENIGLLGAFIIATKRLSEEENE